MIHWASPYIGRPWQSGGQGPESYDCWGLVRAIYRSRYGLELPAVAVDADRPLAVRHAVAAGAAEKLWRAVTIDELEEGDVVVMSQALQPDHVGLWLDSGGVLHCARHVGVCFQRPSQLCVHGWNLIAGYRRRLS